MVVILQMTFVVLVQTGDNPLPEHQIRQSTDAYMRHNENRSHKILMC